jgi:hypothetical protein
MSGLRHGDPQKYKCRRRHGCQKQESGVISETLDDSATQPARAVRSNGAPADTVERYATSRDDQDLG